MSFIDTQNQYHRTVIEIHTFDDGSEVLHKHETEYIQPPCLGDFSCGCRACGYDQEHCEFDPKTGLCDGRMP